MSYAFSVKIFKKNGLLREEFMNTRKNKVIIAHGHLYAFWSTGVYYSAELAAKYNVIFLVPEEYRHDEKFHAVSEHLRISEIFFYDYAGRNLFQHFINCRLFKSLLTCHKPDFVVQHDYIGIDPSGDSRSWR